MGFYTYRFIAGHPLADRRGVVPTHRAVLYEAIGPGPHECVWCASPVSWQKGVTSTALIVDHLDGDGANNSLSNLVASCCGCNVTRWDKPRFRRRLRYVRNTRARRLGSEIATGPDALDSLS